MTAPAPSEPPQEGSPYPFSPSSLRAWEVSALLVGINILWGGSSFAVKTALGTIPPMTLAFARFSLAAVLMYGVATRLGLNLRVARRDWGLFWAMGLLGLALTYLLAYTGIQRTTATDAALIIATEPVFLAILSVIFWRERMPPGKVAGIAAGLCGVYLLIAGGWRLLRFSGAAQGDLLIACGLVFEAASSIVGKGLVMRYPAAAVLTYQMASGALALAPFALFELAHRACVPVPSAAALWSLLYLIGPCTVFAYTVWFTVLDTRDAGEMSVFLFIQPVIGALLGVGLRHERVTPFTALGALLVLLGLALINRRPAGAGADPDLPQPPGPGAG